SLAASSAKLNNGPATNVSPTPTTTRPTVGITSPLESVRNGLCPASARLASSMPRMAGSSESSAGRQNTRVQMRIITISVSSEVMMEAAMSIHASAEPLLTPPSISPTLPMKPENGGIPPKFSAGIMYRMATSGEIFAIEPNRSILAEPVRYSMSPVTRNWVVWMVMLWITYKHVARWHSRLATLTPKSLLLSWYTYVRYITRLITICTIVLRMSTSKVRTSTTSNKLLTLSPGNSSVSVRTMA